MNNVIKKLLLIFILVSLALRAEADFDSDRARFMSNAVTLGRKFCAELSNPNCNFDCRLNHIYYDGAKVFELIRRHTGLEEFAACRDRAESIYLNEYIRGNYLGVQGFRNFTDGLTIHPTPKRDAVFRISTQAAYARKEALGEDLNDPQFSREVSYALTSYINAERMGFPSNPLLSSRIGNAESHLNAWFVTKTAPYVRPFMVALTAKALIQLSTDVGRGSPLPALQQVAESLWVSNWSDGAGAFKYTDREVSFPDDTKPAPDLNLLIAPLYYWLYKETGNDLWKIRGDKIFAGGVSRYTPDGFWQSGAFLADGKHFNQQYYWMFDGLRWREGAAVETPTPTASPIPTVTPSPTATPTAAPQPTCPPRCPAEVNVKGRVYRLHAEKLRCQYR